MQKWKHDVWVGLFVLLGAGAILFLALQAGNLLTLNFEQGYTVNARFDNIGGLKPKAAVRSAGVVVGRRSRAVRCAGVVGDDRAAAPVRSAGIRMGDIDTQGQKLAV